MAEVILKVKVLQAFKDSETQEQRNPGDVLDMTPDRYAEAVARLARWDGPFLEVVGVDVPAAAMQQVETTESTYMNAPLVTEVTSTDAPLAEPGEAVQESAASPAEKPARGKAKK